MSVIIKQINSKEDIKNFVRFGIELYKGNDYFVPPLIFDEIATLNPAKNPAFEHCEAAYFLAYRNNQIVGRIAAMVNHKSNQEWNQKHARFGFVDFIDDKEVVDSLFKAAEDWSRMRGMEKIHGPLGFSDMDYEGMLVEGYDRISTLSTIYNYPYYPQHMERMGYVKDIDWLEFLIKVPDELSDRYVRSEEIVKKRFGVELFNPRNKDEVKYYIKDIFELINLSYKGLYGYVPLSDKQIEYYADMYLPMLRLDFLAMVVRREDKKLIGVGIGLPSLAKALQKGKGRFLPTGWVHIYKALKGSNDTLDLLLVAVHPDYRGKGINALMFNKFIPAAKKMGITHAESNIEMENNTKVHSLWKEMDAEQHKRRRAYIKEL